MSARSFVYSLTAMLGIAAVSMGMFFFFFYHPFTAEVKYAPVKNGKIAYYIRGEGPPILLIEGFGMTMQDWDPALMRNLAKNHTVIMYDLRGVGLSQGDLTSLSISDMTLDTLQLLNTLHVSKTSILGWSMGSLIAQELAISYPEKIDRLILISTFTNDEHSVDAQPNNSDYIQNNLGKSWEELYAPLLFTVDSTGERYRAEYLKRREEAISSGESPSTPHEDLTARIAQEEALFQMNRNGSRLKRLAAIKSPTLIVAGNKDQLLPSKNSEIVGSAIPHSIVKIIPDSGHGLIFQNTHDVIDPILNFLQE